MDLPLFWNAFRNKAEIWASAFHAGHQNLVFDAIDSLLAQYSLLFCFDVTADDQVCYFILSPEGDRLDAQSIDNLIAAAPAIPGWHVVGRRQRKDLDDVRAIIKHLYLIDPLECRFRWSFQNDVPIVEVFIPHSADLSVDEQKGFADTFLWHAIGEDIVMNRGIEAIVHYGIPATATFLSARQLVDELSVD